MASSLGPIDIVCDAPPYSIVRAGRGLGFFCPEDVRWSRLRQFLVDHAGWREMSHFFSWDSLPVDRCLKDTACSCGEGLPRLQRCLFSSSTGQSYTYLLGQCRRCRTIFWEEAS